MELRKEIVKHKKYMQSKKLNIINNLIKTTYYNG